MRNTTGFPRLSAWILGVAVFACGNAMAGAPNNGDAAMIEQLNQLRGIKPTDDAAALKRINQRMDQAWKALLARKEQALPLVESELRKELQRSGPDHFFMLDTAWFLLRENTASGAALSQRVLEKLDPQDPTIRYNFEELVRFAHLLAQRGDPRVLPQLDRIFLGNDRGLETFNPPHIVRLNATTILVFLYGVTGPDAERHLLTLLDDPRQAGARLRVLEALIYLGSEQGTPAVARLMETTRDYDTFARCLTYLMTVGGPGGRDAVANLDTRNAPAKIRDYHASVLPAVREVSFARLSQSLKGFDGSDKHFSDAQLRQRMQLMYDNDGVDNETNPSNLVESGIPAVELLTQLKRIRARMLVRFDNHALDDVSVTGAIINVLQFKAATSGT